MTGRNWLSEEDAKWSLLNAFDKSTRQISCERRSWHIRVLTLCRSMEKIISKGPFKSSTSVILDHVRAESSPEFLWKTRCLNFEKMNFKSTLCGPWLKSSLSNSLGVLSFSRSGFQPKAPVLLLSVWTQELVTQNCVQSERRNGPTILGLTVFGKAIIFCCEPGDGPGEQKKSNTDALEKRTLQHSTGLTQEMLAQKCSVSFRWHPPTGLVFCHNNSDHPFLSLKLSLFWGDGP